MPRTLPTSILDMVPRASRDAGSEVVPFWLSDTEGVPEEGMFQLASELDLPDSEALLATLPKGYHMVFSIFTWEQSRAGEGFSAGIENSGTELVYDAAKAYGALGMPEEANALQRVLSEYERAPADFDALQIAYEAEPNPYKDDWNRIPHVVRILCAGAGGYFYNAPEA